MCGYCAPDTQIGYESSMRKPLVVAGVWLAFVFWWNYDSLFGSFDVGSFALAGVIPAALIVGIPWMRQSKTDDT